MNQQLWDYAMELFRARLRNAYTKQDGTTPTAEEINEVIIVLIGVWVDQLVAIQPHLAEEYQP